MARPIDAQEVAEIAHLARLTLSDEESSAMARDLAEILETMKDLAQVDTSGAEPMTHPGHSAASLREDQAGTTLSSEEALRAAPESEDSHFRVPNILGAGRNT